MTGGRRAGRKEGKGCGETVEVESSSVAEEWKWDRTTGRGSFRCNTHERERFKKRGTAKKKGLSGSGSVFFLVVVIRLLVYSHGVSSSFLLLVRGSLQRNAVSRVPMDATLLEGLLEQERRAALYPMVWRLTKQPRFKRQRQAENEGGAVAGGRQRPSPLRCPVDGA